MPDESVESFRNNEEKKRYELQKGGYTAFVDYILNRKGVVYLTHTEVPKEAEGQGMATRLIENVMLEIDERDYELVPICPFVKVFLQRNSEWKRLLAEHARF
ncbi:MAG: N-acetyltransferase [Bacteroidetes bacterium]|jgi:predicted GNAT family acetyltransferase|nr:N-acetyltransferase [Bacteroidota bacterium]